MIAIALTLISVPSAQASGAAKPTSSGRVTAKVAPESSGAGLARAVIHGPAVGLAMSQGHEKTLAAPERCKPARIAAVFFRLRTHSWQTLREGRLATRSPVVAGKSCHWAKFAAAEWKARAFSARRSYKKWLTSYFVLHDFTVTANSRAWRHAVEEAQKAYPDTAWWLLSCSSTEGGHGRWVPNSDGAPPGGWMQMYESTFWRMWGTAYSDVTRRGFRVPHSANSWYSPLGQALASAWGLTNGRRHEWNSSGC